MINTIPTLSRAGQIAVVRRMCQEARDTGQSPPTRAAVQAELGISEWSARGILREVRAQAPEAPSTTPEGTGEHSESTQETRSARTPRALLVVGALLLAVVLAAPIALSGLDLYRWAQAPHGLGLGRIWAILVPIGLDAAAATCVIFSMISAFRGESGGALHACVWLFSGTSAVANYSQGLALADHAASAYWFFPAMSLMGALLLEMVLRKIRLWVLTDDGVAEAPLPRFRFARWVVARDETWAAWRASVTEGFTSHHEAISYVRTRPPIERPAAATRTLSK